MVPDLLIENIYGLNRSIGSQQTLIPGALDGLGTIESRLPISQAQLFPKSDNRTPKSRRLADVSDTTHQTRDIGEATDAEDRCQLGNRRPSPAGRTQLAASPENPVPA